MSFISRLSFFRSKWPLILGLMLYWALLRSPYFGTLLVVGNRNGLQIFNINFAYNVTIFLVALAATACGSLAVSESTRRRSSSGTAAIVIGLVTAVADYAIAADGFGLIGFDDLSVFAAVVSGVGFFALSFFWGQVVFRLDTSEMIHCLTLSFALSFAVGFLDILPAPANALCQPLLPLCSALACAFCLGAPLGNRASAEVGEGVLADTSRASEAAHDDQKTVTAIVISFVAAIAACAIVMSLWSHSSEGYHVQFAYLGTYLVSTLIAIAFLIVSFRIKRTLLVYIYFIAILVLTLVAGLITCSFVSVISTIWFVSSTMTSLQFGLWVYCIDLMRRRRGSVLVALGYIFCVIQGAVLIGRFILPAILGLDDSVAGAYTITFSLVGAVIILAALAVLVVALLMQLAVPSASGSPSLRQGVQRAKVVEVMAHRFGLTSRESEVMALVSQGNSVKSIAEKLCVADSTVQGHMKVIYRKMGVHSRQDIIDMVEDEEINPTDRASRQL